jgi:Rrf2 family iron-sulfur cluster assembly transcriptional regulator
MRLSQKAQYAICGVFDLAYNGGTKPIQVRVIGERQRIPARYLEQIFQSLRKASLVRAKRGPGGGYTLARPASEITLRDVVEAVEGPLEERIGPGPPPVGRVPERPAFVWLRLAAALGSALERTSFESLCREAARRSVPRAEVEGPMYHI